MEKGPSSLGMLSKLKKLHFRIEFSTGHKPNIPWAGRVQEAGKLPNVKCLALRCLLVMGMENVATIVDSIKQLKYCVGLLLNWSSECVCQIVKTPT